MYLQLCRAQAAAQPTLTQAPRDASGRWAGEPSASCEPAMAFPALRVSEDHAFIHVTTELPGMDPDELEISIDGATLTLRAYPIKRRCGFRVDRCFESFLCRVALPDLVDCARGEAHLDGGVLFLTLPRLAPEPARTVTLQHDECAAVQPGY